MDDSGEQVVEVVETATQTATIKGHLPARVLRLSLDDGEVVGDGADTETVTVEVADGLQVARGNDLDEADVMAVDDDATIAVDGSDQTVTLTDGAGTIDVQTTMSAGSTVDVDALALASHPADSDSVTIEVI